MGMALSPDKDSEPSVQRSLSGHIGKLVCEAARLQLAGGLLFSSQQERPDKAMQKFNRNLSWKLLLPVGVVLSLIGYYSKGNFILVTVGFLGNILFWIGLAGWIAYLALKLTTRLRKRPAAAQSPSIVKTDRWLAGNWFKVGILILVGIAVAIYAYTTYQAQKPKTLNEALEREIYKRLNK